MSPYSRFQHGRYSFGIFFHGINPYTWNLFRWVRAFGSLFAIFSYLKTKEWSKKGTSQREDWNGLGRPSRVGFKGMETKD